MDAPPAYESVERNPRHNPFFRQVSSQTTLADFLQQVVKDITATLEATGFSLDTSHRYAYPGVAALETGDTLADATHDDIGCHLVCLVNDNINTHPKNPNGYVFGTSIIFLQAEIVFVWQLKDWITCWGARCLKKTSKTCSGCKFTRYCSAECQKKDWNIHKELCKWVKTNVKKTGTSGLTRDSSASD